MDEAEDGVHHKHTKRQFDASARSSGWAIASTRLHSVFKSKLTGYGLSIGGVGASVTAVATHQMSPIDVAAVGGTVVASLVANCVDSYIQRRPEVIDKRAKATTEQIEAQSKAQSRVARDEMQQILMKIAAEDPTKIDHVMRMITLQALSALPDQCQFTGRDACELAGIIAEYSAKAQPTQNPPDDKTGVEYPRAVGMG
jgi:hypothetical protein